MQSNSSVEDEEKELMEDLFDFSSLVKKPKATQVYVTEISLLKQDIQLRKQFNKSYKMQSLQ